MPHFHLKHTRQDLRAVIPTVVRYGDRIMKHKYLINLNCAGDWEGLYEVVQKGRDYSLKLAPSSSTGQCPPNIKSTDTGDSIDITVDGMEPLVLGYSQAVELWVLLNTIHTTDTIFPYELHTSELK